MNRIAIQGIKGCFHQLAVLNFFKKERYEILECISFKKLVESVYKSTSDIGVLAIENSIAGTIISNYSLISQYKLKIIGEIYLPIRHHLMSFTKVKLNNIRKVISHPMALLQCKKFFKKYPNIKILEYTDTAESARYISEKRLNNIAAIASENSAKIYNLTILVKNIQSIKNNLTRFFVISKKKSKNLEKNFNKVSLSCTINNKIGTLSNLLKIFSIMKINITNIQSIPRIKKPWEYFFYIDIIFNNINSYKEIKKKLFNKFYNFHILGEYKNGIYLL
jgi:prephenate dehydratase